jgi:hypothetical protein
MTWQDTELPDAQALESGRAKEKVSVAAEERFRDRGWQIFTVQLRETRREWSGQSSR